MVSFELNSGNKQKKKCFIGFCHRLPIIKSKGATLVLVWSLLLDIYEVFLFCVALLFLSLFTTPPIILIIKVVNVIYSVIFLIYPVGGLIADVYCGRYCIISGGIYLALCSYILVSIGCILWYVNEISSKVVIYLGLLVYIISSAGFRSNIIPFNIDQLIGASADTLSTVIYWHAFGYGLGFTSLFFIGAWIQSKTALAITCIVITGSAIGTIVVTHYIFKHWLDATPLITNPVKLIFKVLNYARKNKCPRNRSALTYWEEDFPSRIDLGKEKYGGPFSEEQVEDVKTVLRLIPMLVCLAGMILSLDITLNYSIEIESSYSYFKRLNFILLYGGLIPIIGTILVLFYQFLIYPCFYKYIPSMLFRIRLGLVLVSASTLSFLIIIIIWYFEDRFDSCTLNGISSSLRSNYWILIPVLLHSFGFVLIYISSMEFIIAQSPMNVRGFMIGLWFTTYGACLLLNNFFYVPFVYLKSAPLGCDFYYFLAKSIVVIFVLVIFLVLAKRYKLRIRENIVNIHEIAADHYERYIQQDELYMNEQDSLYGSTNNN